MTIIFIVALFILALLLAVTLGVLLSGFSWVTWFVGRKTPILSAIATHFLSWSLRRLFKGGFSALGLDVGLTKNLVAIATNDSIFKSEPNKRIAVLKVLRHSKLNEEDVNHLRAYLLDSDNEIPLELRVFLLETLFYAAGDVNEDLMVESLWDGEEVVFRLAHKIIRKRLRERSPLDITFLVENLMFSLRPGPGTAADFMNRNLSIDRIKEVIQGLLALRETEVFSEIRTIVKRLGEVGINVVPQGVETIRYLTFPNSFEEKENWLKLVNSFDAASSSKKSEQIPKLTSFLKNQLYEIQESVKVLEGDNSLGLKVEQDNLRSVQLVAGIPSEIDWLIDKLLEEEKTICESITNALRDIHHPNITGGYIRLLTGYVPTSSETPNPEVRSDVIAYLSEVDVKEMSEFEKEFLILALITELSDEVKGNREKAMIAIEEKFRQGMAKGIIYQRLIDCLKDKKSDSYEDVRLFAIDIAGQMADKEAEEAFRFRLFTEPSEDVRNHLIKTIDSLVISERVPGSFREALEENLINAVANNNVKERSRYTDIRISSVRTLQKIASERAVDAIASALVDDDEVVGKTAVDALAALLKHEERGRQAFSRLEESLLSSELRNTNPNIRISIVGVMRETDDKKSQEVLYEAIHDPAPKVRSEVLSSFENLIETSEASSEVYNRLVKILDEQVDELKRDKLDAIKGIQQLLHRYFDKEETSNKEVIQVLKNQLKDDSAKEVALGALDALNHIRQKTSAAKYKLTDFFCDEVIPFIPLKEIKRGEEGRKFNYSPAIRVAAYKHFTDEELLSEKLFALSLNLVNDNNVNLAKEALSNVEQIAPEFKEDLVDPEKTLLKIAVSHYDDILSILEKKSFHDDEVILVKIIFLLGRIGKSSATNNIAEFLTSDRGQQVRISSLETINKLGCPTPKDGCCAECKIAQRISDIFNEGDEELIKDLMVASIETSVGLGCQNDSLSSCLVETARNSKSPELVECSVKALGALYIEDGWQILMDIAKDSSRKPSFRKLAFEQLGEIKSDKAVEQLMNHIIETYKEKGQTTKPSLTREEKIRDQAADWAKLALRRGGFQEVLNKLDERRRIDEEKEELKKLEQDISYREKKHENERSEFEKMDQEMKNIEKDIEIEMTSVEAQRTRIELENKSAMSRIEDIKKRMRRTQTESETEKLLKEHEQLRRKISDNNSLIDDLNIDHERWKRKRAPVDTWKAERDQHVRKINNASEQLEHDKSLLKKRKTQYRQKVDEIEEEIRRALGNAEDIGVDNRRKNQQNLLERRRKGKKRDEQIENLIMASTEKKLVSGEGQDDI